MAVLYGEADLTQRRLARLAVTLAGAMLCCHLPESAAQEPVAQAVPPPERNPLRTPVPPAGPLSPMPVHPGQQDGLAWTDEELDGEQNRCDALLAGVPAVYEKLLPIREGRCGAAIPLKLTAIGLDPAISIGGNATLTCGMTAGLSLWVSDVLQPAAIAAFRSPIARMTTVASYVCRNRYGDSGKPVSEHALANALDIASFETVDGQRITVLDHWPPPAAVPLPLRKPTPPLPVQTPDPAQPVQADATEPAKAVEDTSSGAQQEPASDVAAEPPPPDPRAVFLRAVHQGACKIFGTVLGPDANAAHRDHFHFDMAERRHGNFCQ